MIGPIVDAPSLEPKHIRLNAVSLLLAGSLCLLPFVLPYPQFFQAEWLAAALGIAATLGALSESGAGITPAPGLTRWLAAFALFVAAQTLVGKPAYAQLPLLGALYVLYAAMLVWLGAQLAATASIDRVASLLATCVLVGAMANAAAGVLQFYGRPALLEDFIAELRYNPEHIGAYGNIAQANLYANYLALGGTALLFLWLRGGLRSVYALAAAVLLAGACALSGSRTALAYSLWFAVLGLLAGRMWAGATGQQLKYAAYGLAAALLAAQVTVPWVNEAFHLGPASRGAFERMVAISSENTEARWQAWLLALRVFADAPISGTGVGEFAGAVFDLGLAPEMAGGEVWTSAHNLPLQLLAETGAFGALLALGGFCAWWWQAGRRYIAAPQPAMWWIIAATGIVSIHSMFEFPLWNTHFLGITALVMGLGTRPAKSGLVASRVTYAAAAGTCVVLTLAMAILLRDYVRLNTTRNIETPVTLAGATAAERDAAVMHSLTQGLLAPAAEYWIMLGTPLDRRDLAARLEMSKRLMRYFPSHAVTARRAVFLAFDRQEAAARSLVLHALRSFPQRCKATALLLEQARAADPAAIEPLLAVAKGQGSSGCS